MVPSIEDKRLPFNVRARLSVIKEITLAIELGDFCAKEGAEAFSTVRDRKIVSEALDTLNEYKDDFIGIFDGIEEMFADEVKNTGRTDDKYLGVWAYLLLVIGSLTTIHATVHSSDSNERFIGIKRVLQMQENKTKKHAASEKALIAAIEAEHGTKAATQPFKEAGAILSAVNLRLEARGLKPVKVDVIRRRLEKWPALLKNAENS